MRILVTGGQGQLGSELTRSLASMTTSLGPIPPLYAHAEVDSPGHTELDITQTSSIQRWFADHHPYDLIINCASQTNVDWCEHHEQDALAINGTGAQRIAQAAQVCHASLVHISTDYVFSGHSTEDYKETDSPGPLSAYGRTKLAGERFVLDHCDRAFIVRTSWLYGQSGKNFVDTMLRLGSTHPSVTVVNDQQGNPTNANDLVYQILHLAETKKYGTYHAVGQGLCSWFDFARAIMERARPNCHVIPCTSDEYAAAHPQAAPRPARSGLSCARLAAATGTLMRPWQDALASYLDERLRREGAYSSADL